MNTHHTLEVALEPAFERVFELGMVALAKIVEVVASCQSLAARHQAPHAGWALEGVDQNRGQNHLHHHTLEAGVEAFPGRPCVQRHLDEAMHDAHRWVGIPLEVVVVALQTLDVERHWGDQTPCHLLLPLAVPCPYHDGRDHHQHHAVVVHSCPLMMVVVVVVVGWQPWLGAWATRPHHTQSACCA